MESALVVGSCQICEKDLMNCLADTSLLKMVTTNISAPNKHRRTSLVKYLKKPLNTRTENDRQLIKELVPLKPEEVVVAANCGHVFHRACLRNYTTKFRQVRSTGFTECPICKKPIMISSAITLDLRASEHGKYVRRELTLCQNLHESEMKQKFNTIQYRMVFGQLASRYRSMCQRIKYATAEVIELWWDKRFELWLSKAEVVTMGKKIESASILQTENSKMLLDFIVELESDSSLPQVVIPHLQKIRQSPNLLVKFREDLLQLSQKHKRYWPKLYEKEDIIVDLVEVMAKELNFKLFDNWKEKRISFQLVQVTNKQPIMGKNEIHNSSSPLHTQPRNLEMSSLHKCLTAKTWKGNDITKIPNDPLSPKSSHHRNYKRPLEAELIVPTSNATLIESQNLESVEEVCPCDETRVTIRNSNSKVSSSIYGTGDISMRIPRAEARNNIYPSRQLPPQMTTSSNVESNVQMPWEFQFVPEGTNSLLSNKSEKPFVVQLQRNRTPILPPPTSARNWTNQLNPEIISDNELIPDHASSYFSNSSSSNNTLCSQISRSIIPNSEYPVNHFRLPPIENSSSLLRVPTQYRDEIKESDQYLTTNEFDNCRRPNTPSDWLRRIPRPPPMTPVSSPRLLDYNAVLALIPTPDNSLGINPHFDLGDLGRIIRKDLAKR